jgi:hypothetical protein
VNLILPAVIVALLLCAAGCLIAGVFVLAGAGWALVSAAGCFACLAVVFARGMIRLG